MKLLKKKIVLIGFAIFFLFNGQHLVLSPSCIALKLREGLYLALLPLWTIAVIFEILFFFF